MKRVCFATTNSGKLEEVRHILAKYAIVVDGLTVEVDEIQSDDLKKIALQKAKDAAALSKKPVVVEDTGFFINALDGFPGFYSKYAMRKLGQKAFLKLLAGAKDRSAWFETVAAFCKPGGRPVAFSARVDGRVVSRLGPASRKGLLYDSLFVADGFSKPYSALSVAEKSVISARGKAFSQFGKWFNGVLK